MKRILIALVMAAGLFTLNALIDPEEAASQIGYTGGVVGLTASDPPAAGASGTLWDFAGTIAAMNGSDTVTGLAVTLTNGNHTGSTNVLNGILIAGITGDAEAAESGLTIADGWDDAIRFLGTTSDIEISDGTSGILRMMAGGTQLMRITGTSYTGAGQLELNGTMNASATDYSITVTPIDGAMNGSDVHTALYINVGTGAHTGTSNTLNLIATDALTGDANTNLNGIHIGALTATTGAAGEVEYGVNVGAGWDVGVFLGLGSGIAPGAVYEDFRVACSANQDDNTLRALGDNENNVHYCSNLVMHQRNEGVQTAFASDSSQGAGLNVFNTATNNIGEDIRFVNRDTASNIIAQTSAKHFFEISITIANISAIDGEFHTGYQLSAVFGADPDADLLDSHINWTIQDNAGDLAISCEINGAGLAVDDAGVTWADTETKILRMELATDGTVDSFVDGAAVTMTNCAATAFDSADPMNVFFMGSVGLEGVDPGIVINYVKYGEM